MFDCFVFPAKPGAPGAHSEARSLAFECACAFVCACVRARARVRERACARQRVCERAAKESKLFSPKSAPRGRPSSRLASEVRRVAQRPRRRDSDACTLAEPDVRRDLEHLLVLGAGSAAPGGASDCSFLFQRGRYQKHLSDVWKYVVWPTC